MRAFPLNVRAFPLNVRALPLNVRAFPLNVRALPLPPMQTVMSGYLIKVADHEMFFSQRWCRRYPRTRTR